MGAKNFRRNLQGETGSALLASFMLVTLITGAGLSAMTASSVNQNKAKNVVGSKQALYIAEAALNHGKMTLHQNIANWNTYAAYTTAQTLVSSTAFAGIGSYTVTIKAANNNALLMTATGTVTSSTTASLTDSSKSISTLLVLDNGNLLGNAFITGKNLLVSGDPVFSGTSGGIHANGNLTISGKPTIATNAQTTGTYTVTGTPTVAGFAGGGQPQQTINTLTASQLSGNYDYYFSFTYNSSDSTYHGLVYQRGVGLIADVAPGATWNCWQYTPYSYWWSSTDWTYYYTPFIWTATCQPPDGTYFVLGDAVISGNGIGTDATPWVTTILAYGSIHALSPDKIVARPPLSTETALYRSQTKNLLFVANMDVKITGNVNQSFTGIISAYGQVGISGDSVVNGYVLAQDVSTQATYYYGTNYVDSNYISGKMKLTYNGDLATGSQGNAVPQATLY